MVLVQFVNVPGDEFVLSFPGSTSVDIVATSVARLNNLRNRARRIVGGLKELALYGPMREESQKGLSVEQLRLSNLPSTNITDLDPHALRVGVPPSNQLVNTLQSCANDLECSIMQVGRNPMDEATIIDNINKCRGAVMMAYPMGLPPYDPLQAALADDEDLSGSQEGQKHFDERTSQLWFVGKKMQRDQPLNKYSGAAEKTMIKVKMTSERGSAPQRESGVDAETQKQLVAMWHKKQQEAERLAAADDDSYLNSAWANPQGLKESVYGLGSVRYR